MDQALLAYSEKITFSSDQLTSDDLQRLRDVGYTEKQVLDIVLVTAYRHYITRIADGTGISVEEGRVEESIRQQYNYSHDGPRKETIQAKELPGSGTKLGQVMDGTAEGSWARMVDPASADDELRGEYRQWEELIGTVPNWIRAISLHQVSATAASRFARYSTFGGSPLGSFREHLIGYLVASLVRSPYFYGLHGTFLEKEGAPEPLLRNVEKWRDADLSPEDRIRLEFAEQMTLDARTVTQETVDRLREAGLSDPEVLDVIMLCSFLNCFLRAANALGVPLDPISRPFYERFKPAFCPSVFLR